MRKRFWSAGCEPFFLGLQSRAKKAGVSVEGWSRMRSNAEREKCQQERTKRREESKTKRRLWKQQWKSCGKRETGHLLAHLWYRAIRSQEDVWRQDGQQSCVKQELIAFNCSPPRSSSRKFEGIRRADVGSAAKNWRGAMTGQDKTASFACSPGFWQLWQWKDAG